MAKYLHPGILSYYGLSLSSPVPSSSSSTLSEIDCAATIITFLPSPTSKPIIEGWLDCAMNKDCIAPKGSDRMNSRQDQSALTILSATLENGKGEWYKSCTMSSRQLRELSGVSFHRFDQ